MSQNPTPDQYPGEAPNPGLQPQPVPQEGDGLTPEERDQRQRDRLADRPDGADREPATPEPATPEQE